MFAQNIACSYYGWREKNIRMGPAFRAKYAWLMKTEMFSKQDIIAYQDKKVSELINHAYSMIPYYRDVMRQYGLTPDDIQSCEELKKLPVLTKEDVISNFNRLFSASYIKKNTVIRNTSGTTGKALQFSSSRESIAFQWAVWWRHRHRFGVEPFEWHINFTGKRVVPVNQRRPPYWRINFPMRQVLVNMHHISPEKLRDLVQVFNKKKFKYFSGYPSILHSLATNLLEAGIEIPNPPDAIFLGAEKVYEFQKAAIESAFSTRVTDQYGLSEGCGNASQCEFGNYHEDWEFCVLERVGGGPDDGPGVQGKIVATGFSNYIFPFIRYETGDTGVWAPDDYRCPCGRESRVIFGIEGRNEDYVVTPEGARIMRFDYVFKDMINVMEAQIIQKRLGEVVVRVVPRNTYTKEDRVIIEDRIKSWISPTMRVEVEEVESIGRTSSGKFRAVVSELQCGFR